MRFGFVGGPYDGMDIDPPTVYRYASVRAVDGDVGSRLFVLLPPREEWDRLVRGEAVPSNATFAYERFSGPEDVWFQSVPPGTFERAQSESRLKVHSRARIALAALSMPERRRILEAADALQHRPPEQWPNGDVLRISEEEPDYLLRVPPDLRALVRLTEGGAVELSDIVRKDALELFRDWKRPADATR
jgi:hypothetical protein